MGCTPLLPIPPLQSLGRPSITAQLHNHQWRLLSFTVQPYDNDGAPSTVQPYNDNFTIGSCARSKTTLRFHGLQVHHYDNNGAPPLFTVQAPNNETRNNYDC